MILFATTIGASQFGSHVTLSTSTLTAFPYYIEAHTKEEEV